MNREDSYGYTALKLAPAFGQEKCVEMLLNKKANINVKRFPFFNSTALDLAVSNGYIGCIKLLQDAEQSKKLTKEKVAKSSENSFFSYFTRSTPTFSDDKKFPISLIKSPFK